MTFVTKYSEHSTLFICRWFCHFDDDNYVNIPKLVELLNSYNPDGDWYLGKPSIASPLEIYDDIVSIHCGKNILNRQALTLQTANRPIR